MLLFRILEWITPSASHPEIDAKNETTTPWSELRSGFLKYQDAVQYQQHGVKCQRTLSAASPIRPLCTLASRLIGLCFFPLDILGLETYTSMIYCICGDQNLMGTMDPPNETLTLVSF